MFSEKEQELMCITSNNSSAIKSLAIVALNATNFASQNHNLHRAIKKLEADLDQVKDERNAAYENINQLKNENYDYDVLLAASHNEIQNLIDELKAQKKLVEEYKKLAEKNGKELAAAKDKLSELVKPSSKPKKRRKPSVKKRGK